jgi:hypothetical protein
MTLEWGTTLHVKILKIPKEYYFHYYFLGGDNPNGSKTWVEPCLDHGDHRATCCHRDHYTLMCSRVVQVKYGKYESC